MERHSSLARFLCWGAISAWGVAQHASAAGQEVPRPTGDEPVFGQPARRFEEPSKPTRVPAGIHLHRAPDASSPVLLTFDLEVELPALDRQGDWVRLQWAGWTGWARLGGVGGEAEAGGLGAAELGRGQPPDPDRLARLLRLLGGGNPDERAGTFQVLTDLPSGPRLGALVEIAAAVHNAYARAWGLAVPEGSSGVVGIFAREESYRLFEEEEAEIAGIANLGHAGRGVAALAVGEREPEEVEALLIHELVHLLNRRSLPATLPPWLEEGLAEGLAISPAGAQGELRLAELRGRIEVEESARPRGRRGERITRVSGSLATLDRLATHAEESRTPLARLFVLSWHQFLSPESRPQNYATAAFLLRFLARDPDLGPPFRLFLAGVAEGGPADGEVLLATLGLSVEELEARFASALLRERNSYGLP